jgi:chromosome segregation ATPase
MASLDWGTVLTAMLGGGLLTGGALLVRAFTHRRQVDTDDWESTLVLTERILATRTKEAEQSRERADRILAELRAVEDTLAAARRDAERWQERAETLEADHRRELARADHLARFWKERAMGAPVEDSTIPPELAP